MMQKFKFLSKEKKKDSSQNEEEKTKMADNVSMLSERKLVSRNAVICSSGKDKYRYDSERAEVPDRLVKLEPDRLVKLEPNHSSNNLNSIHASRASMYSSIDFKSSAILTRQRSNNIVKRDTVVNKTDLQPSMLVNGRFQNPWPNYKGPTFTNILKLGLSQDKSNIPSKQDLNRHLPIVKPNFQEKTATNLLKITWLGHSTVLVDFDNIIVLTDPIFSERASPSQVFGPKRFRDSPCTIHDLPINLDAVVISHSHYDHLDLNSVIILNARYAKDLRWFIPKGLGEWFNRVGCENVIELDWWEENCVADKSDVSFTFTPTQHWSKRTLTDDNKSLWGSWVIKGPNYRFFFTGDTGYCNIFKQIGSMYGPFDAAAIPIGSYEPRWYMKCQHINPNEAVKVHKDIKSKFSIAIHWGTFAISNEPFLEPKEKLSEEIKKDESIKPFVTILHGESVTVSNEGEIRSTLPKKIIT